MCVITQSAQAAVHIFPSPQMTLYRISLGYSVELLSTGCVLCYTVQKESCQKHPGLVGCHAAQTDQPWLWTLDTRSPGHRHQRLNKVPQPPLLQDSLVQLSR